MNLSMEVSDQEGVDCTDTPIPSYGYAYGMRQAAPSPPPPSTYATERYKELEDAHFEYHMKHQNRGLAYIINNDKFCASTGMSERAGSSVDRDNLIRSLQFVGFKTAEISAKNNMRADEMVRLMEKVASMDHSNNDCVFVAILSHGDDSCVYGTDRPVPNEKLLEPFKESKTLAGKPKIFVIQACRGEKLDTGIVHDALPPLPPKKYFISKESDFLLAYSVVPGYYSWRNCANGSWFIQALSEVMQRDGRRLEFVRLLTRVNRLVSYTFKSNAAQSYMNNKKQSPCVMSMLTKDLYFA